VNQVALRASSHGGVGTDSSQGTMRVGVTALDFWAFGLPALSFVEITLGGRLMMSELLALVLLPWLLTSSERLVVPRWFIAIWCAWLLGQMVTDIVVGSAFVDYSRGWARILFTLTNFAAILALVSTPRRARLFALGLAVGGVLGYLIFPDAYAMGDPWKWAFALPIGFILAAGLSGPISFGRQWPAVCAFAGFGVMNLRLGFRSLGGVALLSAAYLILQALVGRSRRAGRPSPVRVFLGLFFCLAATLAILRAYDAAAASGVLGSDAEARYFEQSGQLGILIGGRSEALASSQAILDSPLLGHGSWAKDSRYANLLDQRLMSLGYELGASPNDVGLIPTHSYVLGSWVEAGLVGGVFWLAILALAVWLLANLYTVRLRLSPLLVFSATLLAWSILFSPYGNDARLLGPYGIATCLLGLRALKSGGLSQAAEAALTSARALHVR
jgi:hypothetical protein